MVGKLLELEQTKGHLSVYRHESLGVLETKQREWMGERVNTHDTILARMNVHVLAIFA